MSTAVVIESKAAPIAISKKFLDRGANLVLELRLNGIDQRDKEIVLINMLNRVNNGQRPAWQSLMADINDVAGKCGVQPRDVLGLIVDHLFERLDR